MDNETLIEMKNIGKSFFGVTVFKDFSLNFRQGEVHCICGENGAGKSTLIKILSGAYQPNGGEIFFEGKKVVIDSPRDAIRLGIQTIYQEHTLYATLSVYENLFVGQEYTAGLVLNKKAMVEKTKEILRYLDSEIDPYAIIGQLSGSQQKVVEIARCLIVRAKVVIMDEPTSSFSMKEIQHLLGIVRQLKKDGICIIYISHHLEEVFQIADQVTVIRDGVKVGTYGIEGLSEEQLINSMVGRDVGSFYSRETVPVGEVMFRVERLCGNGVKDINFEIHKGEILGFSGMVGAGKTEMAQLLFGAVRKESGKTWIKGKSVEINSPKKAIENGMCYITESRQHTGLFLTHSIMVNTVVVNYNKRKGFLVNPRLDRKISEEGVKRLNIITTTIEKIVKELSGGNQQKVVLSKWFSVEGEIYIFDEPTRGIDVGAKEEIYKLMTLLVKEGKCILLISSDMPELIGMSNRIFVMRGGNVVAELNKGEISEQRILKYSIGGTVQSEAVN